MIPKVRQWLVTTSIGTKWIVLAPTHRLALLNYNQAVGAYNALRISPVRRQRTQPGYAKMAWRDH